ncbi:MAG: M81 family metallopeptidase, partial [Pseudomonadota bacterium]
MPRVFVGGLFHEANAFSPIKTPLEAFDIAPAPLSGSDEASGAWVGYSSFLRAAKASGAKVVAGFYAMATPSAPCSAKTYQALKDRLIASLKQAMPVDAVCLFLHGAQTAQGEPDCAGDIALMIRQMVGPHVPIGVALDL